MKKNGLTFFALLMVGFLSAQVSLDNASFEGEAQDATVPIGWHACEPGSTPDILPGSWGVYNEAYDGETYMGLITRQDGTWESVGQRLSDPIQASECYTFSLSLAHSKTYANYNKPIKVKIWGGASSCTKDVLLAETSFIKHSEWKRYEFRFIPKQALHYLILEAHYMDGIYFHYNGNVLIDNCSEIKSCKRADQLLPLENWESLDRT
ncbi:MAG: carbohydrate binding domain-containing protein [Bacteroidota bacterium]